MSVLNGCIFLLLIAGHTELWVAYVNRTHGLRVSGETLHHLRRIHDLAVVSFPIILIAFVGLSGPRILLGGSWSDVGLLWRAYLLLCCLGLAGLIFGVIRWQLFSSAPSCQTGYLATICDYSQLPAGPPIGDGPHAEMLSWPSNQQMQLEISEKHFEILMPDEWQGAKPLRILHLSDWHFIGTPDLAYYEQLVKDAAKLTFDMVVFTGDLIDNNELIAWIEPTLGQLSARLGCHYILGNHDWPLDVAAVRRCMDVLGWTNLAGCTTTVEHDGRSILLGGSEMPWMEPAPDFSVATPDQLQVLLSHSPDNFGWARDRGIQVMLSGHNHGGQVILPIIGPVYSPALSGVKFSHGEFFAQPTLLHVSRGIGGRHPLRWNCRPEITTLVLRPAANG